MTWKVISTRSRQFLTSLRSRFTRRSILLGLIAIVGSTAFLLLTEAMVRSRLPSPDQRVQTAVYSRPISWGRPRSRPSPIPIGTIQGPLTERRIPYSLAQFPDHLIDAVLAIEDQRFYGHHGLDVWRIGGALIANLRAGRISQGGSTVSQQLSKNLFLSARRTPLRKLREAAFATILELRATKDQILEAYLNEIYLGQDGRQAIHGIGAAAEYYFGKSADDLTIAESALLAGMIQAPNRYNPIRNARSAAERRNVVLGAMALQERISPRDAERARKTRVRVRPHPAKTIDARYFLDAAVATLPGRLPRRGAAVYTTLDPAVQRAAERAVREGLSRIKDSEVQAALVAIDPKTGDVLAMVGGRDYGTSQFNRATAARRQPGSAFKPVVALAALGQQGDEPPAFTLASRIEDAPLSIRSGATQWEPVNYDRTFRGEVSLREAIEASLNVPIARVGLEIGPQRIAETARRLGIASPMRPVPSLALGSSEVTLLELVRAYGVFAASGLLATTRTVVGQTTALGSLPDAGPPDIRQVADPAEAYLVTSALEGVIERGTGKALRGAYRFGSLAGKTGTSNDWRDAWFVAYSPGIVVGAWVGYDDGRSLRRSGASAALPIVARFLQQIDPGDRATTFPVPDGIEMGWVSDGESSWWGGTCGTREVFLTGTAPKDNCVNVRLADWLGDRIGDIDLEDGWGRRTQRAVERFFTRLLADREKELRREQRRRRRDRNRQ